MKKYVPQQRKLETMHHLEGQPGRDTTALILPISAIKVGTNVRTQPGNLEELTASVKEHGIIQALVVSKTTHGLELVAGHRRLEAAKQAGLTDVPVRVINADENQIAILRIVENVIREDLTGVEEVRAIAALVPIYNGNQVELARALGKSKSYVSKCLKAAQTIKTLKVSDPKLSLSMLFELAYSPDPTSATKAIGAGEVTSSKDVRKPSGPIHGGRYNAGALQFRENKRTRAFSLRINFDPERTPADTRIALIKKLQEILARIQSDRPQS